MLEFKSNNYQELADEFNERSSEVSTEILLSVCDALDEDVDIVVLGFMINVNIAVNINKIGFLEALELNIKRAEEAEEYELCARARSWIKKLKNK